jgi:quinol-cytochrome oxidoreductase complex cytochrome b subunit/mono/diheme cytochrome c family protein
MNRLLNWLNDRTDFRRLGREMLYERVPGGARWRYVWGSTLVFTFVVQVITGLMLWTAYSPSAQTAWESVYYIQNVMTLGWLVRGIHHFAAQVMIVLLVFHVVQIVVDGAYKAPREVNFWLGIILMQIVLGLALTGYLLPWDQKGYYATRVATNIARATPVVGQQVQELAQGGKEYGHHTLTRFFALHAGILPALLVGFLVLHLAAFRRHGVTAPEPHKGPDVAFWPDQVLKDSVACLAVLAGVMGLAIWRHGAELNPPADPSEAFSAARPEWYFLFLFRFLKFEWVERFGLAFGAIYVPGALMLVFVLMPILAYFKWGHRFNVAFLFVVLFGSLALTAVAIWEDREDPEHQLALVNAERDAHRAVELAELPGRIPVEGAIKLLREDPFTQGPRLFAKHCASCHRWDGHDGRGKMVYETSPKAAELQQQIAEYEQILDGATAGKAHQMKVELERQLDELEDSGKATVAAYPTAVDLADFGGRAWMQAIVIDYSGHFAPLQHSAWYEEYRQQIAAGEAEDDARKKKLHAIWIAAEMAVAESRLDVQAMRLARLQERRLAFQADALRGLAVDDELAHVAQRITAQEEAIAETEEAIATFEAELKVGPKQEFDAVWEGYLSTILDPAPPADPEEGEWPSEMAAWSAQSGKVLQQPENAEHLEGLVEYLVSLGGRGDLELDADKVELGAEVANNGEVAAGEIDACANCHDTLTDDFVLSAEGFGYPDLAGYASATWLKAFLSDPGTEQFYGKKNHMPAYGARMSPQDLDLLVRWMARDYPATNVHPYPSQREALQQALDARKSPTP